MSPIQRTNQGAVTGLILKLGLAKTAAQANVVMLIITVIAVGLTIYLLLSSRSPTPQASDFPMNPDQGLPQ